MKAVTFDSIQKNIKSSQKIDKFIGESFENSNFDSILPLHDTAPHCITLITRLVVCY